MADREKLIELLDQAPGHANSEIYSLEKIVDYLIANGVTVGDKWVSTAERLPEIDQPVLVWTPYGRYHEAATYTGTEWVVNWDYSEIYGVTHWMPLPEPPKGD